VLQIAGYRVLVEYIAIGLKTEGSLGDDGVELGRKCRVELVIEKNERDVALTIGRDLDRGPSPAKIGAE
jgi:hypothetical protein